MAPSLLVLPPCCCRLPLFLTSATARVLLLLLLLWWWCCLVGAVCGIEAAVAACGRVEIGGAWRWVWQSERRLRICLGEGGQRYELLVR
jgi:hypothetical protein